MRRSMIACPSWCSSLAFGSPPECKLRCAASQNACNASSTRRSCRSFCRSRIFSSVARLASPCCHISSFSRSASDSTTVVTVPLAMLSSSAVSAFFTFVSKPMERRIASPCFAPARSLAMYRSWLELFVSLLPQAAKAPFPPSATLDVSRRFILASDRAKFETLCHRRPAFDTGRGPPPEAAAAAAVAPCWRAGPILRCASLSTRTDLQCHLRRAIGGNPPATAEASSSVPGTAARVVREVAVG